MRGLSPKWLLYSSLHADYYKRLETNFPHFRYSNLGQLPCPMAIPKRASASSAPGMTGRASCPSAAGVPAAPSRRECPSDVRRVSRTDAPPCRSLERCLFFFEKHLLETRRGSPRLTWVHRKEITEAPITSVQHRGEEFQILQGFDWTSRYYPTARGEGVEGPGNAHGRNFRVHALPSECMQLEILWDLLARRVTWKFLNLSFSEHEVPAFMQVFKEKSGKTKRGHHFVWPAVCCSRGFNPCGFVGGLGLRRALPAIFRGGFVNPVSFRGGWQHVRVGRTLGLAIWWPHNLPTPYI